MKTEQEGNRKTTKLGTTSGTRRAALRAPLPDIETFPNQYKGYEITIEVPEYTAICPKTNLPDFGTITLHYMPDKECLELKALKMYVHAYRNLGIFYENAVNRILQDIVNACRPVWARVTGTFTARGGFQARSKQSILNPAIDSPINFFSEYKPTVISPVMATYAIGDVQGCYEPLQRLVQHIRFNSD